MKTILINGVGHLSLVIQYYIKDNFWTDRAGLIRNGPFLLLSSYAPSRYTIRPKKNDWLGKKRGCDRLRNRLDLENEEIWENNTRWVGRW